MARSSYSVVAISINRSDDPLLNHGSDNERELSLAIYYVQGENISRKSCIHENILR